MLAVLGGLAEFERDLIKCRTSEGRRRAIDRGVKMGPKFKLTPEQRKFAREQRTCGTSLRQLSHILGVSRATIWRASLSEHGQKSVHRLRSVTVMRLEIFDFVIQCFSMLGGHCAA